MALTKTTTEKYGVARNGELLDRLYDTEDEARRQHAHIAQTMEGIGLEPDVDLVSVTETVSYSKLHVIADIVEPDPADEETDATDGDTEQSAQA